MGYTVAGREGTGMGSRRGKGEGSVYKDAQGRWVAAVPLPPDPATGRRRRKVFRARSKVEALRRMREARTSSPEPGTSPPTAL